MSDRLVKRLKSLNLSTYREGDTRQRLLAFTETGLEEIAQYKRKTTVEKLGARVGNKV